MSEVEFTQGVCQDGAAILANGNPITIEQILDGLRMCQRLSSVIECQTCKGAGGGLGDQLGFYECDTCGGDGHRLYDMEGTSIREILDYESLSNS